MLSDEFLDSITKRTEHPNVQIRLLEKLLNDEIKGRMRSNQMQAKVFSEEVRDVKADPVLAKIAHELVEGIRTDLTVD